VGAGAIRELDEITAGGDYVVARMRRHLRGKSSGVEVDYDYWLVVRFRDGKMARAEWFEDRDAALKAAGLSE
jgi:ketosteroid isomerase-like protein